MLTIILNGSMTLQALNNVTSQLSHIVSSINVEPVSYILVTIGFALLLIIIISGVIYGLVKVAKAVPSMSTKEFLLFLVIIAVFLVVLGILLP
jgi:ABC-type multidrug transport system permease subunit